MGMQNPTLDGFLVSVIVTCKGRLAFLQIALPSILDQRCPFQYEVIVVDYGCPQKTFEWTLALRHPLLRPLLVQDDTEYFNRSRAKNIGAVQAARGHVLAFIDCDIVAEPNWLRGACRPIIEGRVGLTKAARLGNTPDIYGTCCVSTKAFHTVRGFDESFIGWGFEDTDLYNRVIKVTTRGRFNGQLLRPILHDDCERVRYSHFTDKQESRLKNRELAAKRGVVNPNGFGRGVVLHGPYEQL